MHTRAGADALSTGPNCCRVGRALIWIRICKTWMACRFSRGCLNWKSIRTAMQLSRRKPVLAWPHVVLGPCWGTLRSVGETWLSVAEQVGSQPSADDVSASPLFGTMAARPTYLELRIRVVGVIALKPARSMEVRVLMPAAWPVADQDWLVVSLRGRLANLIEQLESQALLHHSGWSSRNARTLVDREYDDHVRRWARAKLEAMLILAVDSALTRTPSRRWQSIGELFTLQHQVGVSQVKLLLACCWPALRWLRAWMSPNWMYHPCVCPGRFICDETSRLTRWGVWAGSAE